MYRMNISVDISDKSSKISAYGCPNNLAKTCSTTFSQKINPVTFKFSARKLPERLLTELINAICNAIFRNISRTAMCYNKNLIKGNKFSYEVQI